MATILKTAEEVIKHFGSLPQHKDLQMLFNANYSTEKNGVKHFSPFPVFVKVNRNTPDNALYEAYIALGYSKKNIQIQGISLYFNHFYGERVTATKSKKPTDAFKNEFLRGLDKEELCRLGQSGQLFAEMDKAWADEPAGNNELSVETTEDVAKELGKLYDAAIEKLY